MAALLIVMGTFCLGRRPGRAQTVCFALLNGYLFLVYSSTVFTRGNVSRNIEWMPFWSYKRIFLYHDRMLLMEDLLNVAMMFPVGVLIPAVQGRCRLRKVILAALLIELSIEGLQYFTKRGLAEWDDIFHGVIGGILGYGLYQWLCRILARYKRDGNEGAEA